MSFGKNLFVFVSGAVVGAGALAGFAGWQMYKALKKNDILYTAVRSSVDAGVKAASSEFSEHGAKAIVNKFFGWGEGHKLSYPKGYKFGYPDGYYQWRNKSSVSKYELQSVCFESQKAAQTALDDLIDIIDQYGTVTVADFYDEAGLNDSYYSSTHYGWKDIGDAYVAKVRSGWSISLPDPIKLE